MDSIVVIDINDAEYPTEANGIWYLNEIYGELPETRRDELISDGTRFCLTYRLPKVMRARHIVVTEGIEIVSKNIPGVFASNLEALAPMWLVDLLAAPDTQAYNLNPDAVRDQLVNYLSTASLNAAQALSGMETTGEVRPFHQGDAICFNQMIFATRLGVRCTREMSVLYGILTDLGVQVRKSVTITMGGKRKIMKLARVPWNTETSRELRRSIADYQVRAKVTEETKI